MRAWIHTLNHGVCRVLSANRSRSSLAARASLASRSSAASAAARVALTTALRMHRVSSCIRRHACERARVVAAAINRTRPSYYDRGGGPSKFRRGILGFAQI